MDKKCCKCGDVPQTIIRWKRKWYCKRCDEKRRRADIEATGTIIDDDGVVCDGCLFGIRLMDLCVADPNGDGPFHYNCAVANGHDPKNVRIAPDEFEIFEEEDFLKHGTKVVKPN
jgi:hypothetical protein